MPPVTLPVRFAARLERIDTDIQLVTCMGELDLVSADSLDATLARTADAGGLVIDLTQVPFMDSTGIGVLLEVRRRYPGGRLSVCCPAGMPYRILEVMGMHELFSVRPTVDQALASLALRQQDPADLRR